MSRVLSLATILICTLTIGCGPGVYPVSGKVVWSDGSPAKELADGHVVFELPQEDVTARGIIQSDASFRMTTNIADDGARQGEHRVFIMELRGPIAPNSNIVAPGILDPRFADAATSGLTATIKPGDNEITLTVERARNR